jgi:pyruvate/2-oxoglutarate dehydrogenase complex dihydrolipoamide acyltransferase (E2) component
MSRNVVALGAFLLVGALLWLVTEWPAARDEVSAPVAVDVPAPAAPAPPPPPAAESPTPTAVAAPEPAAEEPAEPAAAAPPAQVRALPELIPGDQGPVAEYRKLFESEPRDSSANQIESDLRAAFPASDGAPDLIKSVLCRQTLCRIEMRWSQDRARAYIVGFSRLQKKIQIPVALSPVGAKNPDGGQLVEVYMKLKSASAAATPDHPH